MKKVLIGLAAGALAVTAMTAPVSAADPSILDLVKTVNEGGAGPDGIILSLVEAAGLDEALDDCDNGATQYTVFLPGIFTAAGWNVDLDGAGAGTKTSGDALLEGFGISLGGLLSQGAVVKSILLNHVLASEVLPAQMDDPENTKFNSVGGLEILKTNTAGTANYFVNGIPLNLTGYDACNGYVYLISGILAENTDLPTLGLTNDGSATQAAATGEGLPATGTESLALTYAALASLIAGAGVLVIRRRSVA